MVARSFIKSSSATARGAAGRLESDEGVLEHAVVSHLPGSPECPTCLYPKRGGLRAIILGTFEVQVDLELIPTGSCSRRRHTYRTPEAPMAHRYAPRLKHLALRWWSASPVGIALLSAFDSESNSVRSPVCHRACFEVSIRMSYKRP